MEATSLQSLPDGDRIRRQHAAGTANDVVVAPVPRDGIRVCFLTEVTGRAQKRNSDALLQRQHAIVLQQDRRGSGNLARQRSVLAAGDVGVEQRWALPPQCGDAAGAVECASADPAKKHAASHVVDPGLAGRVLEVVGVPNILSARHDLVQAAPGGVWSAVDGPPVAHHPTLEAHPTLQVALDEIAVLACLRTIDGVVGAHDGG
mmetsp:Transcript_103210/g.296200  ORF Transcript_103210/g.296200 Transcript_103210/m.296200 type:complete len:204 (+) Transcript_103210:1727-2338(+)